jgi:hypothetical protein
MILLLVQKKILTEIRFDTTFGLKMMVKSGLEKIILKFHDGLQSCCCPGRLEGISESDRVKSKYFFLDHFSPSFFAKNGIKFFVYCLALKTYMYQVYIERTYCEENF